MKLGGWNKCLVISAAVVGLPSMTNAETLLPKDLLSDTDQALTVMQAGAEVDSAKSEWERDRAKKGWRAFASFGYANIHDVIDVGRTRDYNALQGRVGLSYPLLGSYEKDKRDVDTSAGKLEAKTAHMDVAHQMAALELESGYADYWAAQESLKVVDAYLANEQVMMPVLRLRQEHRLMLQSQLLDLQQGYEQARSDRLRFERLKHEAANRLSRLTNRSLGDFEARLMELPPPPQIEMDALMQKYPDLAALRAQRKSLQAELSHSGWYGVDSNFEVSQSGVEDLSANQTGGTTYVGMTLNAPLGIFGARRAERNRLQAEIRQVQLQERKRGDEVTAQVQNSQEEWKQLSGELEAADHRTQASSEALREGALRAKALESQGIEPITLRLHDYYKAALAQIDAQLKAWQANIDVRGYAYASAAAETTGAIPRSSSLGSDLADPILRANQQLQRRGGKSPAEGGS